MSNIRAGTDSTPQTSAPFGSARLGSAQFSSGVRLRNASDPVRLQTAKGNYCDSLCLLRFGEALALILGTRNLRRLGQVRRISSYLYF
jgi:hypothetical protein